jgi:chemotaxis protein methyltransferase CheR
MTLTAELTRQAETLVATRLGLHFSGSRRADLERGILAASRARTAATPEQYLGWLAVLPEESAEWRHLAARLTVGETYFFRDAPCFATLEQDVLPELIAARRASGHPRLRVWSAGCASGEEAYSIAILLDRLLPDVEDWALTILATDINTEALAVARRGLYREWSFRETPRTITDRYFRPRDAGTFEIDPRIRRMVTVAPLNLAADIYPSAATNTAAMDVILCRNVMMYFTRDVQQATIARLARALVPGGWLVVSAVEASTERFAPLTHADVSGAFYRRHRAVLPPCAPPPVEGPEPVRQNVGPVADIPADSYVPACASAVAPAEAPSVLAQARRLADRGELELARRQCERALAHARLDPGIPLLLAAICQEQGDVPAALDALRRAIYLAPDSPLAYFLRGGLESRQGRRARARRSLETAACLLQSLPRDAVVEGSDGLTAGALLDAARLHLEAIA